MGLSLTRLSTRSSNTNCSLAPRVPCPPSKLLASVLASGLLSEFKGRIQTDASWPQDSLSQPDFLITESHSHPVLLHLSLSLSLSHTHTHTHTHLLSMGLVLQLGGGFVSAESSGRLKSFLSILPMNHVALVQGYWPVSAWGSLQANSDFQTPSCFLLGWGSACHFSRKPGLPGTPSTLHLPWPS